MLYLEVIHTTVIKTELSWTGYFKLVNKKQLKST